jgi:nicotinate phosphoribosyltransferase
VWRGPDGDTLALRDEPGPTRTEALLEPVMRDGVRTTSAPSIDDMRARSAADLEALPATARRLRDATPVVVRTSAALAELTERARSEATDRAGLPH